MTVSSLSTFSGLHNFVRCVALCQGLWKGRATLPPWFPRLLGEPFLWTQPLASFSHSASCLSGIWILSSPYLCPSLTFLGNTWVKNEKLWISFALKITVSVPWLLLTGINRNWYSIRLTNINQGNKEYEDGTTVETWDVRKGHSPFSLGYISALTM